MHGLMESVGRNFDRDLCSRRFCGNLCRCGRLFYRDRFSNIWYNQMFTVKEVVNSFRRFNDLSNDVRNASFQTWGECLLQLIVFCREDGVMRVVTEPLRTNPNVNFARWWQDFNSSGRVGIGTKQYELPTDNDDRISLLYQFFVSIVEHKINAFGFALQVFGKTKHQEKVNMLNSEIVEKFTREVAYRLKEVEKELGEREEVESSALTVFHYHGPVQTYHGAVQNIEGGIHGGIAAQNSTVTGNVITYNDKETFAAAVKALGEELTDVLDDHREAVSDAFALLVKAIQENTVPKTSQMATAIETIGEGSPGIFKSLKTIVEGAATSLVAEALKPLMVMELARMGG